MKVLGKSSDKYEAKKRSLLDSIAEKQQGSISLYKETSNLFRDHQRKNDNRHLDVRSFNQVIHVDHKNLIAEVEGMTTYETLVKETLKQNCLPTVVPELKSITIGGALSGCGIESSSFRYGLVHETIKECEVLLSSGEIVTANHSNEHRDLFYALANTYGTLGYALKVKVELVPVKKYVKLTHRRFHDAASFFSELKKVCLENRQKGEIDFIDGVIFSKTEMYIIEARFVDEAPYTSNYRYMNIYYKSIQERKEDYLTPLDYIWRWDTDWFWCSKVFLMDRWLPRLLLGKFMLKSTSYTKLMRLGKKYPKVQNLFMSDENRETIIQDVLVPVDDAQEFLTFFQDQIKISPIWICPTMAYSPLAKYPFCDLDPNTLYVDFGFWDSIPSKYEEGHYNRLIEKKVNDLKGFKSLYSSSYYTLEEFWELFNLKEYQNLKEKYDSTGRLKNLYDKCCNRL